MSTQIPSVISGFEGEPGIHIEHTSRPASPPLPSRRLLRLAQADQERDPGAAGLDEAASQDGPMLSRAAREVLALLEMHPWLYRDAVDIALATDLPRLEIHEALEVLTARHLIQASTRDGRLRYAVR